MLKITIDETSSERRWILQGRLVAVWVDELRKIWKSRQRSQNKFSCVVDLNNVTFIDKKGERLLRTMSKQGAQFVANGVYIRHVLNQIVMHGKPHRSQLLSCVFAGIAAIVLYQFPARTKAGPPNSRIDKRTRIDFNAKRRIEPRMIAAAYPSSGTPKAQ